MKSLPLLAAIAAGAIAVPALAQEGRDTSQDFDGPYISAAGGYTAQSNDRGETLIFDTNRDGTYGDTVRTVSGADAFSPGFCGGAATSTANAGCRNDNDDPEYYGRIGYDRRMGNIVVGVVLEGGRTEATDSVSGFSTTPARYAFTRSIDYQLSARLRAGYTPGGGILFYATGGGAFAKLDNDFATSNGANSFANNGRTNAYGYAVGGGAEVMLTSRVGFGLEYLHTDLQDDDYVVNIGPGTAAPTNPFLLNGGGTNVQRSDDHFRTHSLRATVSYRF